MLSAYSYLNAGAPGAPTEPTSRQELDAQGHESYLAAQYWGDMRQAIFQLFTLLDREKAGAVAHREMRKLLVKYKHNPGDVLYTALLGAEHPDDDQMLEFSEFEKEWHAKIHVKATFTGRAYSKNRIQSIQRQIQADRKDKSGRMLTNAFTMQAVRVKWKKKIKTRLEVRDTAAAAHCRENACAPLPWVSNECRSRFTLRRRSRSRPSGGRATTGPGCRC